MIKANLLTIKLVGRLARSGTQEGKQKNKNLAFYLSKDNINELFSLVKTIDTDKIQFRKNYFMQIILFLYDFFQSKHNINGEHYVFN